MQVHFTHLTRIQCYRRTELLQISCLCLNFCSNVNPWLHRAVADSCRFPCRPCTSQGSCLLVRSTSSTRRSVCRAYFVPLYSAHANVASTHALSPRFVPNKRQLSLIAYPACECCTSPLVSYFGFSDCAVNCGVMSVRLIIAAVLLRTVYALPLNSQLLPSYDYIGRSLERLTSICETNKA